MAQDKFKHSPSSFQASICGWLFFLAFVIAGCASSTGPDVAVPSHLISELQSYESLEVWANRTPWTRTGLFLKKGDRVVIFASGQVSVSPVYSSFRNLPPNNRLIMKIGEKYFPRIAVWSWGHSTFSVEDNGQLMFAVKDWDGIDSNNNPIWEKHGSASNYYSDNIGSFSVDVFVFKTDSTERIFNILETIAYHNPTNYKLRLQIAEFIRHERMTIASANTTHEIEELKMAILSLKEDKLSMPQPAGTMTPSTDLVSDQHTTTSQTEKDQRLAELELKLRELEQSKSELDKIKLKYEEEKSKTETLSKELEERGKREQQLLGKLSEDPKMAPVLVISSPENESHSETGVVRILGAAEDDRGIATIEITVNGKLVEKDSNRGIRLSSREQLRRISFDHNVNLVQGVNLIYAKVTDTDGMTCVKELRIHYAPKNLQVWAVVVGINNYANFPKLRFAVNDAEAVYRYLIENNRVPAENIFLLIDRQASIQNLRNILGTKLKASVGEKDMVIIYFAGHGSTERDALCPDGDGLEKYLLAADSDPADIYSTALPMREIGYLFSRINSERIVFLVDSCYTVLAVEGQWRILVFVPTFQKSFLSEFQLDAAK
jgi:hypothetical protein